MALEQAFNERTDRWVKYNKTKKGCKILDVKQKNPLKPFKGVKKKK